LARSSPATPARAARPKARPRKPPLRAPRGARERALLAVERLATVHPAICELDHRNAFELTIATILSAQSTDKMVNSITPELFRRYPTAADLASADPAEVERLRLVATKDPEKIETIVTRMVPPPEWTGLSLRLILHGRRVCDARRPLCEQCVLNDFCPSSTVKPA
jgi:endonuclease III